MKKMMKPMVALALTLLFCTLGAVAQMGPLPVDPAVRTGTLDNSLTYYIRHNELPKGQAEFYIAQKVGSMQEEDNQRGLAHFLEHMAFNGTTNFPDKTLMGYLESVGAKFGYNINAYTSFDKTVYTLMNIPVAREGVVDSALLVLKDWACGIALKDAEIDAERGVIHEEWRTGQSAQMRIFDQLLPVIFEGSRYGHRLPIGTMEVIDNFPYQDIRDYYSKWYRPDMQGIIVVGDIDVDAIEAKIKDMFGSIPMPADPAERVYFEVPDNDEPIVAFAKDKELPYVQTLVMYKHDPLPVEMRNSPASFVKSFMQSMVGKILGSRLEELTQKPEPPFMGSSVFDQEILGVTVTKEALTGAAVTDEAGIEKGFRALLTELRRVKQHGFTPSEYERAKADFLTQIETAYNERDKQRNNTYANEYVRAFTDFEPIPGIETEYALYNQLVPMLPVDLINQYVQELIDSKNVIIMMQGPDREGVVYPAKEEILAIFNEVAASDTEPYVEEVSDEPLVPVLPKKGQIKKTAHDPIFDATVWTLSNGAKVVVKPTAYKDDEIRMSAVSPGGTSLIGPSFDNEVMFLDEVAAVGGLGNFSATDLPKVLAGKNASVNASAGEVNESVTANCAPRDLETMMQLVYLQFTAIRTDDDAFASWRNRTSATYRNMASNPMYVYSDSLSATLYANHPRHRLPTAEAVESVDYARSLELFKARFADASNFTFLFVGNVELDTLRPLVEQYIATLPSTKKNREKAGTPVYAVQGHVSNFFKRTVESPKVTMAYVTTGAVEPTLKNAIEMDAMWQVLFSRYFETLREDEGGTYSPQVQGRLDSDTGRAFVLTMIDTNADLYGRLGEIIVAELEKLATEGPGDADYQKVKEYMLKTDIQNRQENSFWMGRMRNYYLNGRDHLTGYAEAVGAMTKEDIRDFARRLIDQGNRVTVTMDGIAAPAATPAE